ncbi:hypothetical protein JTI73_00785 [Vibrio furnissii]|nr:hypothetical protein JTI73_00785 [Vibrio furnissii]
MTTLGITLLALASLLMSGFVAGSPAMNVTLSKHMAMPPVMSMPHRVSANCTDNSDAKQPHPQHAHASASCDVSHDMKHSCCDTTCTNTLALMACLAPIPSRISTQTQYHAISAGDVIHRTQTLYRPPSA